MPKINDVRVKNNGQGTLYSENNPVDTNVIVNTNSVSILSGPTGPQGPEGPPGPAGASIADAYINDYNNLFLTLTDNSVVRVGILPTGPAGPRGNVGPQGNAGVSIASATGEIFNPPALGYFPIVFNANSISLNNNYSSQYGFNITTNGSIDNASAFIAKTITNSTWEVVARIRIMQPIWDSPIQSSGIILYNSANGKTILFGRSSSICVGSILIKNTYPIGNHNSPDWTNEGNTEWFKVSFDGSRYSFYISLEGFNWVMIHTELSSSYLNSATHLGIGFFQQSNFQTYYNSTTVTYWNDNA